MNIVSLLPSATEMLYLLDEEPVAVSHQCDFPRRVRRRPVVTRTSIDTAGSSAAIDSQVRDAAEEGELYTIDTERLEAQEPDLIITQGVCDVCALNTSRVTEQVQELDIDAEILQLDSHTLPDVLDNIRTLGEVTDKSDRAEKIVARLQDRIQNVRSRSRDLPPPRTVVLDWMDPPIAAGHWMPGLVERAGGTYPLVEEGSQSRPVTWDTIAACDPDVLIAAPCGFPLHQALENRGDLTESDIWDSMTAVQEGNIFLCNGNDYLNRPGPRLVASLEHIQLMLEEHEKR